MADSKKYDGSQWEHSLRKLTTATADIEPTIYTDGTAITAYTIKGNTVQNGTPTPSDPVPVIGVGELETTGEHTGEYKIPILTSQGSAVNYLGSVQSTRQIKKFVFDGTENWANAVASDIFGVANLFGNSPFIPQITALCTEYAYNSSQSGYASGLTSGEFALQKYTSGGNESYTPYFRNNSYTTVDQWKAYLQQQYAAGTPVTVWYVLETPTTAIVNEPLMKIGTYADSISNAAQIPTTEGANSITVDTTVQPSEFTATWTGWHDSSAKEWDGSDWQ